MSALTRVRGLWRGLWSALVRGVRCAQPIEFTQLKPPTPDQWSSMRSWLGSASSVLGIGAENVSRDSSAALMEQRNTYLKERMLSRFKDEWEPAPYVLTAERGAWSESGLITAATKFWRGYPAYRRAKFESGYSRSVRDGGYLVMAIFPEGEAPEPVEVQGGILKSEIKEYEERFWKAYPRLGLGKDVRAVFFHPSRNSTQYFRACMEELQKQARKISFEEMNQGDGSAEAQWGKVFGGVSQ